MYLKEPLHLADFRTSSRIYLLSTLAVLVGLMAGFIAIALLKLIGLFTHLFFYGQVNFSFVTDYPNHLGAWVIAVPAVGGLLVGLMARYGSEKIRGHGIPEALEAILIGKSEISAQVAILKPLSAAISIGSGGPFGAEGPIIMTGGSFGSLFSQFFSLTSAERKVMLVAGAAGGMAATFAAPLASVLFAVELLVFELRPRSLVPIVLAVVTAYWVRLSILGGGPLFPSHAAPSPILPSVLLALGFGLTGGLMAWALTRAIYGVEDLFARLPLHFMWWPVIAGLLLGVGGYLEPHVLGVGYDNIRLMLAGQMVGYAAGALLLGKALVWVVSLGSGTSGGILAPLLIIGGALGAFLSGTLHIGTPPALAMLGMAAAFAGVTRSPLTTVVFLFELSHDQAMLVPVLLTSILASLVTTVSLPRSILTEKIARRGLHITRDLQIDPLELLQIRQVMSAPPTPLPAQSTLHEALLHLQHSAHTPLLVVENGRCTGLINGAQLQALARTHPADTALQGLLGDRQPVSAGPLETVRAGLYRMIKEEVHELAVLDQDGRPLGLLTKADLLAAFERQVQEELVPKRPLGLDFLGFNRPRPETAEPPTPIPDRNA